MLAVVLAAAECVETEMFQPAAAAARDDSGDGNGSQASEGESMARKDQAARLAAVLQDLDSSAFEHSFGTNYSAKDLAAFLKEKLFKKQNRLVLSADITCVFPKVSG